jgi:hypothetical protein
MGTKIAKALNKKEFEELTRVTNDVFFFATFIKLIHPVRGKVPFDLFPFQKRVLWHFLTERYNIVLKFRQAGITELISMFCLWMAMYHREKNIVIISIKDRVAKKVLRKIKYMYRNLPEHLQMPIVNGRGDDLGTATEIEFANGSIISSIPTTEDAGRSEAVSLAVIDEAAIVRWANQIWAAMFPTLSTGGKAIINSTPYGVGNWFHKMWVDACTGGSKFFPIRLKWWMHPERDMEWYRDMKGALGDRRTAQEIDGDFLSSGNNVFNLADIKAIEEELSEYPPIAHDLGGSLLIFKHPVKGERYSFASDVSTGRSRDYSAGSIMDSQGEEVVAFKKKIAPRQLAEVMMKYGEKYNWAELAPESNDIGLAVTSHIEEAGYRALYYSKALVREKGQKRPKEEAIPGWYTTKKNRPIIIAGLEEDIRLDNVIIKDPFFVDEAYTFIYDESNKAIAMGKNKRSGDADDELSDQTYTDDAILGKAITNHIRKTRRRNIVVAPQ